MPDSAYPTVKIGFHLGPQHGEYRVMRNQWMAAEELGVDALYSSDHFFAQDAEIEITTGERPHSAAGANFEGMTLQAAMAADSGGLGGPLSLAPLRPIPATAPSARSTDSRIR